MSSPPWTELGRVQQKLSDVASRVGSVASDVRTKGDLADVRQLECDMADVRERLSSLEVKVCDLINCHEQLEGFNPHV